MSKKPILISSRYKPAAGGHAPGDLRDAFLAAVEDLRSWRPGMPEPVIEVRDQPVPLSVLCGLLWNCTDCLPGIDGSEVWAFVDGTAMATMPVACLNLLRPRRTCDETDLRRRAAGRVTQTGAGAHRAGTENTH